jgi:hypothetical protein
VQLSWGNRKIHPCRPAAENANAETRGSTDIICRTARTIAQGASDLESFLLRRFPLAMPVENSWQSDIGSYKDVEMKDGHLRSSQKCASIGNKGRQESTVLYSSSTNKGPALRMRSKAASCMPSLQAGGHAPCAMAASLQAALDYQVSAGGEFDVGLMHAAHCSPIAVSRYHLQ